MRAFLSAFVVASGVLAAGPVLAQQNALVTYCKPDIERLCKGTEAGGGRLIKCLKSHSKEISVGCAQALQKLQAEMK